MEIRNENYVKSSLKSILKISGVYTVHYFKYGKNFNVAPERHDFWEMVYVDSGEVGIIADDKEFTLKQGEAFFHRPNELHTIYTNDSFGNTAIISFECTQRTINYFADKIFVFGDFEKGLLGKIINETPLCFSDKLNQIYLTKMTKRKDAPIGSEQVIKNCIELMLLSLLRKEEQSTKVKKVTENVASLHSDKIVVNIIKILNEHLYTSIDLDTIAKELFFSKTYIKTVFKKHMNTSIIQYYIFLKIEESKKLISQNKYTYTEIAYLLGFNSVHYFSRLFKSHTQMTPSEYSKSIKADNLL
ncbi:MAG: helix-turn-helix transcriptional regulator [Clostridia bacterium]|nr:helix-turn-helix transcriptional regulator [Clostridia bacterium]